MMDAPGNAPDRQFKGVWICARLWDCDDLTPTEKFLVAVIDSLSGRGRACFAGNDYLAKHLRLSETHMRDMLAKLTTDGYIIRLSFNGRTTLRCIHPDVSSDPSGCKQLMREYKVSSDSSSRMKPIPQKESSSRSKAISDLASERVLPSRQSETDSPRVQQRKKTTTTAAPNPVVVASSVATSGDEEEEIANKLVAEFGPFNKRDARWIENQVKDCKELVLDAAAALRAYVKTKPVRNLQALLIKAINDAWPAPKAQSAAPKPFKPQRVDLPPSHEDMSAEDKAKRVKELKAMREGIKSGSVL